MHDFSTGDGFVEVTENLADMLKFVANEPSVGLFYVQQHTHNAAPNLITLKKNVLEKSHETALHTEDSEDSILMLRSMKECGFPIVDEMIGEIKKSLSIMSSKKPKRGLIQSSSPGFVRRTSSWSPARWGRNAGYSQQDNGKSSGYLSSVFKTAKQRANDFTWPQVESAETSRSKGETLPIYQYPATQVVVSSSTSMIPDAEMDDLPLSSRNGNELEQESQLSNELEQESQLSKSLSQVQLLSLHENYEEFKADREAKLEKWLDSTGKGEPNGGASAQ